MGQQQQVDFSCMSQIFTSFMFSKAGLSNNLSAEALASLLFENFLIDKIIFIV
jgi:hypothetical protein